MDDRIKQLYAVFGYDVNKELRKLTEITDDEALNVANIFNNELGWQVHSRDHVKQGHILLKSDTFQIGVVYGGFEHGPTTEDHNYTICLRKDGEITGPIFAHQYNYILAEQYLLSIGIERPVLTESLFNEINSKTVNSKELLKSPYELVK